jgi:hypothetical protein
MATAAPSAPPPDVALTSASAEERTRLQISRGEWQWLAIAVCLIVLMTQIPPSIQRVVGMADRVHVGTYWYPLDFSQYLAAMNEGATSPSWLIYDHLSAEPHSPILMYPLYVAIGKLAALVHLPVLAVYAAAEQVTRILLPVAIYLLAAICLAEIGLRRFAFVLANFSSGLGVWVWVLLSARLSGESSGTEPPGANAYLEVITFGNYFAAPHVGLGLAATLVAVVLFLLAVAGSVRATALLAVDLVFLALVHPFNLPVLLAAFGVLSIVETIRQRRLAWPELRTTAVAGLVSMPFVVQSFLTYTFDPFWGKTYGAQNVMPSPPPWSLPIDYGIILPLAVVGVLVARRRSEEAWRMLLVWLAVGAVCMYLPVTYQRRFAFGLQPVLAVLAALSWPTVRAWATRLAGRLSSNPSTQAGIARRLVHYPLLTLGFTTTISAFLAVSHSTVMNFPIPLYIVDRDTYAVGAWLAEQSGPDDVVAASFYGGNVIGGMVPGRVVAGYPTATLNMKEKLKSIEAMYKGESNEAEIRQFLDTNRATFLVFGPEERKVGPSDPGARLGFPIATRIGETIAYRVPVSP